MRPQYHRVFSKMIGRPLMCEPSAAMTIYNYLAGRFGTASVEMPTFEMADEISALLQPSSPIRASRFSAPRAVAEDQRSAEPFLRTPEGVAIVTVDGEMVNRGAWVGSNSGTVSYEGVKHQMARAANDPKTKATILDVNTPGGEAIGAAEMGAFVKAVAAHKPVFAVANGMAASAGYSLVSGATRVFNTPSGILGSIGVILLHMDMTGAADLQGIKPTLVTAGDHKANGHPMHAMTDDALKEMQHTVDMFYEQFAQTVGNGRGRKLSATAAKATEARLFVGADAQKNGLADDTGSFEDILTELTQKLKRQR